jgi:hypothetical protein
LLSLCLDNNQQVTALERRQARPQREAATKKRGTTKSNYRREGRATGDVANRHVQFQSEI